MKKIFLSFIILITYCSFWNVYASSTTQEKIGTAYAKLAQSVEKKHSLVSQIYLFTSLQEKLEIFSEKNKNTSKQIIIDELQRLNNNHLFKLNNKNEDESLSQLHKETSIRNNLSSQLQTSSHPSHIEKLQQKWKKLYITDDTFQFVENDKIFRIRFSSYFPIDSTHIRQFYGLDGVIIYSMGEDAYRFVSEYTLEEKLPFSQLQNVFTDFVTHNKKYVSENETYYGYIFNTFSFLQGSEEYGATKTDLLALWFSFENTLLYRDTKGRYNFVTDYQKKKLIPAHIIDGIPDKELFLSYIVDDKRWLDYTTDELFLALKKQTLSLTKWKKRQEKIDAIYDWVLHHVTYTTNIDLEDERIFSWIDTYKNKDGVCTGYSKLTSYMLMYAWVSDSEVIRGDVIDAPDFPRIWHAWLRIGDKYYDPTFDDPIGALKDKTKEEYKYYNLPRDLLYTNRFNTGETPTAYKSLSLEKREKIVAKRLFWVADKYPKSNYNILDPIKFRKKHGLNYDTPLNIEILSSILPVYEVNPEKFTFVQSGKTRRITHLKYYPINVSESLDSLLRTVDYNLENTYLFLWGDEYRLAYDVSLN